jgi:hypothetical protein
VLYTSLIIVLASFLFMVWLVVRSKAMSSSMSLLALVITITQNFCLLCFKTVFYIPMLGVSITAIRSGSIFKAVLGAVTLALLAVLTLTARLMIVDFSPFKPLPYSSFGYKTTLSTLALSTGSVLYFCLDPTRLYYGPFLIINAIVAILCLALHMYSYKPFLPIIRNF